MRLGRIRQGMAGKEQGSGRSKEILREQMKTEPKNGYPFEDWSSYGGGKEEARWEKGTAFSRNTKENGRCGWLIRTAMPFSAQA